MSLKWILCHDELPPSEMPVLANFNGSLRVLVLETEIPTYEEGRAPFRYWDDPNDPGQEILFEEVSHWAEIPGDNLGMPEFEFHAMESRDSPPEGFALDDFEIEGDPDDRQAH